MTILSYAEEQQEHDRCELCTCVYHRGKGHNVPVKTSRARGSSVANRQLRLLLKGSVENEGEGKRF